MEKKIAIVIPAFNEQDTIAEVVSGVNALNTSENMHFDAVVINDCSTDNTSIIAEKLNCILLDLPINLGIGGAVQTGFKFAFENNYDYAIQVDGDGQHSPAEIPKLINAITQNEYDVIGSRFINKEGFQSSFSRRIGIIFFKYLILFYCRLEITDSTSGFRLLNKKALALVSEYYPDEYPEPESIILFYKNNLKIGEVAVEMRERQGGRSSIRAFNSLYYMVKVSIAIFFTFIRSKIKIKS